MACWAPAAMTWVRTRSRLQVQSASTPLLSRFSQRSGVCVPAASAVATEVLQPSRAHAYTPFVRAPALPTPAVPADATASSSCVQPALTSRHQLL